MAENTGIQTMLPYRCAVRFGDGKSFEVHADREGGPLVVTMLMCGLTVTHRESGKAIPNPNGSTLSFPPVADGLSRARELIDAILPLHDWWQTAEQLQHVGANEDIAAHVAAAQRWIVDNEAAWG